MVENDYCHEVGNMKWQTGKIGSGNMLYLLGQMDGGVGLVRWLI